MGPSLGGDEGNRTPDPLLAKQVLSQLSYTPKLRLLVAFSMYRLCGTFKIEQCVVLRVVLESELEFLSSFFVRRTRFSLERR